MALACLSPDFLDQRSDTYWILLDMTIVKNTYLKRDDPYIEDFFLYLLILNPQLSNPYWPVPKNPVTYNLGIQLEC